VTSCHLRILLLDQYPVVRIFVGAVQDRFEVCRSRIIHGVVDQFRFLLVFVVVFKQSRRQNLAQDFLVNRVVLEVHSSRHFLNHVLFVVFRSVPDVE